MRAQSVLWVERIWKLVHTDYVFKVELILPVDDGMGRNGVGLMCRECAMTSIVAAYFVCCFELEHFFPHFIMMAHISIHIDCILYDNADLVRSKWSSLE